MNYLKISLIGFGLIFCSVYGLFQINLFGGWAWSPSQPEYQLMIVWNLFCDGSYDDFSGLKKSLGTCFVHPFCNLQ